MASHISKCASKHGFQRLVLHIEVDVSVVQVSMAKHLLDHLGIVALGQQPIGERATPGMA